MKKNPIKSITANPNSGLDITVDNAVMKQISKEVKSDEKIFNKSFADAKKNNPNLSEEEQELMGLMDFLINPKTKLPLL